MRTSNLQQDPSKKRNIEHNNKQKSCSYTFLFTYSTRTTVTRKRQVVINQSTTVTRKRQVVINQSTTVTRKRHVVINQSGF